MKYMTKSNKYAVAKTAFTVIIFALLAVILAFATSATDENPSKINTWDISENEDGSVVATLYEENGEHLLVISGAGIMREFSSPTDVPWSEYFDTVVRAVVESDVVRLAGYCFLNCTALAEIRVYNNNIILPVSEDAFRFTVKVYGHRKSTVYEYIKQNYPNRFYALCEFEDSVCNSCAYRCESHVGGIPTCTEAGKCSVCKIEYIPALEHRYFLVPEQKAYCYQSGKAEHYKCLDCENLFDVSREPISAEALEITVDHSYGELRKSSPPTCTEPGFVAHYECSDCEKLFDEEKNEISEFIIPEKGHKGGVATCLSGAVCTECNAEYTDLDSENHSFSADMKYDENMHWLICECGAKDKISSHIFTDKVTKRATETETGILESSCECGYKTEKLIPKLDPVSNNTDGQADKSGGGNILVPLIISASLLVFFSGCSVLFFVLRKRNKKTG